MKRGENSKRNSKLKKVVTDVDRVVICIMHEQGMKVEDIAKQFNISTIWVYTILGSKEGKEVRQRYKNIAVDSIFRSISRNDDQIDDIIDSYIYEARRKSRIQDTDLRGLFTVFNTLVQSKIKLKELTLKEQELEIKSKMADAVEKDVNTGLLSEFVKVIEGEDSSDAKKKESAEKDSSVTIEEDDKGKSREVLRDEMLIENNDLLMRLDQRLNEEKDRRIRALGEPETVQDRMTIKKNNLGNLSKKQKKDIEKVVKKKK